MNHTPGHRDCPACREKSYTQKLELSKGSLFPVAANLWIESRGLASVSGKSKFVAPRTMEGFEQYVRALQRFFAELTLQEIHLGHIRQYQEDRSSGLLGPTRDELFKKHAPRMASKFKVKVEELEANPQMLAILNAELDALPLREVNPNKVNQEVSLLVRFLKSAGVWTSKMDEEYEPLLYLESNIPQALTPDEQVHFLAIARQQCEFIYHYSIVGIDCVLSTKEERSIKIGDVNLDNGILMVRAESAKNKYRIRTIPLTPEAIFSFQRLIERAAELGSHQPNHYLFPFASQRTIYDPAHPMTVSGVKKRFNLVRDLAGLPWFTPYDLRHTGCTRYAESGMSIHTLLELAGHMSRKMQQHYVHISESAKRKAVEFAAKYRQAVTGSPRKQPRASHDQGSHGSTTVLTLDKKSV